MYCYCRDEFDWFINMLKKGNGFIDYEHMSKYIDEDLLELRYMKKRFGYVFYDEHSYIKKVDWRNCIFVNKEHQYVCRKPEEPTYHGIDENGKIINVTIPMKDTDRYEIKFLDEIDKGDPFITKDEKYQDDYVKNTKNIFKKILMVKPEIYNSSDFYEVLYTEYFDEIELEKDREKLCKQIEKYVLDENIIKKIKEYENGLTEEEFKETEIF